MARGRALDRSLSTGLAQLQSRFRGGNERGALMSITYPPEMLPSPDEGSEADIIVNGKLYYKTDNAMQKTPGGLIDPTFINVNADCEYGSCIVEAHPTGRKEQRGEVGIRARTHDGGTDLSFTPGQARRLAEILLDLADKAERFSTRGFVGSDE